MDRAGFFHGRAIRGSSISIERDGAGQGWGFTGQGMAGQPVSPLVKAAIPGNWLGFPAHLLLIQIKVSLTGNVSTSIVGCVRSVSNLYGGPTSISHGIFMVPWLYNIFVNTHLEIIKSFTPVRFKK